MIPPIASRFIAGETDDEVLEYARTLNDRGVGAIINLLGEHHRERATADDDAAVYAGLLDAIGDADLRACLTVKPSQLGLDVDESIFREHLRGLVDRAADRDGFVWVDMEDHTTTDATLSAVEATAERRPGRVGVALQANLTRTPEDLRRLSDVPGKVRLVKGAYDPPEPIAIDHRDRVTEVYLELLEAAFRSIDAGVAVGSHDPVAIDRAIELGATYETPFELQMLMGVRESAQFELADDYDVWQYVPYGDRWFSYFSRRVAERKENLLFALRAILGR